MCVMEPDLTLVILILTFRPSHFTKLAASVGLVCVPRILVDSSSGLPTLIGMHHGQISGRAFPALRNQTIPDRTKHSNTPTARSSCHRVRAQSASLATQPASHYQAHYVQCPRTCPGRHSTVCTSRHAFYFPGTRVRSPSRR